jgi:hypothetical protein
MLSAIEIIEGFGKIMTGYLLFMDQSEIVRKSKYIDTILYNGANIVIHVFTMHVYANQTLENIYSQCGKSYVCYLEYIEQLDKTNLANNLYISDISIFVYKLTLGELVSTGDDYLNPGSRAHDSVHCIDLVVKTWNTLLAWNSCISFNARLAICDVHLSKYAILFHTIPVSQIFLDYLGIIQEKWEMDENVYFAFLNEYYRRLYKLQRANKLPEQSHISEKILLFCIQYHLEDKPTEENIRSIVSTLL